MARGCRGGSEISPWLRLSAVQSLGRAGEPDRASDVSATLSGEKAISRDSVRIEVARAAFASGDTARGLALADSLSARGAALLAGRWLVPALLERGDTAAAMRAARQSLELRRADASVGETYLALDTTLSALRLVAESDLASGRSKRAVELLETGSGPGARIGACGGQAGPRRGVVRPRSIYQREASSRTVARRCRRQTPGRLRPAALGSAVSGGACLVSTGRPGRGDSSVAPGRRCLRRSGWCLCGVHDR